MGRHPTFGYVAMNMQGLFMTDHVLQAVDFHPVPGTLFYALADPARDGDRRAGQAITSLRAAGYSVEADLSLDPHPPPHAPRLAYIQRPAQAQRPTTLERSTPVQQEAPRAERTSALARAAVAHSPHDTQLHLTPVPAPARPRQAPTPASRPSRPGNPAEQAAVSPPSPHDTQLRVTPIKGVSPPPAQQAPAPDPVGPATSSARAAAANSRSPRWRLWSSGNAQQLNTPPAPARPPQLDPRPQPHR